ncbi:MAG: hypothetical protein J7549_17325 [Variovorax sp.]|nr:hypothetical protein [Variovorax sp.]
MNVPDQQVPPGAFTASVAGEEDPGAAVDAVSPAAPMHPGDEAPPGTPGSGEALCHACGGTGRSEDGTTCLECDGTGRITAGIGGG